MSNINEIEKLTKDFSEARRALAEKVHDIEDQMNAIKRRYLSALRKLIEAAAERSALLKSAIEESPELFEKPRTFIFHGVKVGMQKQKGELLWDDNDKVVELIKKYFKDQVDMLIKTVETPLKKPLAQLSAADLKKLGVTVEKDSDVVVIKSTDSEIDKLVSALLKDAEDIEEAA